MDNYDSTEDTLKHIRQVGFFLAQAVGELCRRASRHDHSKMMPEEKEAFDRETPMLKKIEYGTPEYKTSLERLGKALQHHYRNNSHHPEHYPIDGIAGMDLFDLVEMVSDWKAAVMRMKNGVTVDVDYNAERFGINPQLVSIIKNTLNRWPDRDEPPEAP